MTTYGEDYTRYQLDRGALRRWIRHFYLDSARNQLHGATVDFGCGVGELLRRLPAGSVGLEINSVSVSHCKRLGLDARVYDADKDDWSLSILDPQAGLKSLVVSHVLEHLDAPADKLRNLLLAARRLGIEHVLVIVPGKRGYDSDETHRTFIDIELLSDPNITADTGFTLFDSRHFPVNARWIGDVFTHHELQATFKRAPT